MGVQSSALLIFMHTTTIPLQVPLMNIKSCTEKFLEASSLDYTTFRLCGFHQVCETRRPRLADVKQHVCCRAHGYEMTGPIGARVRRSPGDRTEGAKAHAPRHQRRRVHLHPSCPA